MHTHVNTGTILGYRSCWNRSRGGVVHILNGVGGWRDSRVLSMGDIPHAIPDSHAVKLPVEQCNEE